MKMLTIFQVVHTENRLGAVDQSKIYSAVVCLYPIDTSFFSVNQVRT
ncbi:hypothetical protein HKBW3S44_00620 [Candidatus Hakubella thermalkaliphila]|uniref:Uncharacterized protein n=1 Tax=Candidatus Hakubella thermalkaliphila TaxID=2754717 RepID=A0A6V8PWI8_9ACTN|nr:hypothetical protein HKBW3S44_00620 [Candidatus Hakubella thermalkaliphila]